MGVEKFKMSYTYSVSGSLEDGLQGRTGGKMYQRETIFGKLVDGATIPFKSLSFYDGSTSVTKEEGDVRYTVTLQNKDLIIEAEVIGATGSIEANKSLSNIFHSLPTVYDENGDTVDPDLTFVTANNNTMSYISIPNMVTDDPIS